MRHTDLAARYGGDEFVMVLVHTGAEGAIGVAEKVRSGVEVMGRRVGLPPGLVRVSMGVGELCSGQGPAAGGGLGGAGYGLYRAKAVGRNQVSMGVKRRVEPQPA